MKAQVEPTLKELEKEVKTTHKKYSIEFKLKIINLIYLNLSYHYISKWLGIDMKVLRDWVEKEESLKTIVKKDKKFRIKKKGFITKLSEEEEEKIIISWIRENREKNKPINTKSLLTFDCPINKNLGYKNLMPN